MFCPTTHKHIFAHEEPCYHLCMHINKRILLFSVSSLLLLTPLLTSADTITRTLSIGTRGQEVISLQTFLISQNLLAADSATGYFGRLTRAAVVAFQSANNLETVGWVGRLTRALINGTNPAAQTAAAGGNSVNAHTKTDTTAPSTPTNLTATAVSSSQINLAWTASTDNVGVKGYQVFRNGVQTSGTPTTNSYSDTGLTASTAYTYTVKAVDAAGNVSAQSAPASATTLPAALDTTAPSTPTNLTASAISSSQINLTWTASTDNVGVTGYKIFRGGSATTVGNQTIGSKTDTGDANYINATRITTGATAGPVQSLSVNVASPIDPSPNNQYSMAIYSDSAGSIGSLIANTGNGTLTGNAWNTLPITATLLPNTSYWFAYNTNSVTNSNNWTMTAGGTYGWRAQTFGTWPISGGPLATGGYTASIYATFAAAGTATTNSYSDTGLTASTAYTYTVSAYDAAGNNSAQSASASATTQAGTGTNTTYGGVIVAPYPTTATTTELSPAINDLKMYLQQMDGVTYQAIADYPAGPPGYAFCSLENATCSFNGTVSAAFGANGTFFYKTVTGSTPCRIDTFNASIHGSCFIPGTPPPTPYTGAIPASSIALLLATSPSAPSDIVTQLQGKGPEAFYIRGDATSLKIIANDERGLSDGIYYYLEQLGVRWLLQGPNWTIVPPKSNVTLTIDKLVVPGYSLGRQMGPTGANFQGWRYPQGDVDWDAWAAWARHLRTSTIRLAGDVVDGYVLSNWQYLQYHPDYFAKIDGVYSPLFTPLAGGNFNYNSSTGSYVQVADGTGSYRINAPKLNAGSPAGVNYFCTWVVNGYKTLRSQPGNSWIKWASVEPSDGFGYANNYSELQAAGVGNGSGSDQTFYIADQCAKMIKTAYSDASVMVLAYAGHAAPSSFVLEPNVIVEMTPYRFGDGTPVEDFIAAWKAKASTLAVYDYWSIPVWSPDKPHYDYLNLSQTKLRYLYNNNVKGLFDETTQGAAPVGILHYVAEHIMWDPTLDDKAIIDDWYTLAFGPAKAPIKRMMERWSQEYMPTTIDFAYSYQDINQAEQLAAGNPAVQARVDDWARYLRYLQLWYEASNAPAGTTLRAQLADALALHIFDIEDSQMIYTTYMFDWAANLDPSVATQFSLANPASPGPGWANVHDLTHADIMTIIANGISAYPASDVMANNNYTGPLVPLNAVAWTPPPASDPWGGTVSINNDQAHSFPPVYLDVVVPSGLSSLPIEVASALGTTTLAVFDASMNTVYWHQFLPIATTSPSALVAMPNGDYLAWQQVNIPVAPGHYQLRLDGRWRLRTWKGVPLSWPDVTANITHYDENYAPHEKFYFYVPVGTQKFAFYTDEAYDPKFAPVINDPSGNVAVQNLRDQNHVFVVTVPTGQDGKVWSIFYWDYLSMINIPKNFSLDPTGVLVPSDAK